MSVRQSTVSPVVAPRSSAISVRFLILLTVILIVGASISAWRVGQADHRLRSDLLHQATLMAWAMRADDVERLSGAESDLSSVGYDRIKDQMVRARSIYPLFRTIRLTRQTKDGRMVVLADSEPAGSANHAPPGTAHADPTDTFRMVFERAHSEAEGPYHDRRGTWISASVPLFHPLNDRLVAVLSMDVDAAEWRSQLRRQIWVPAGSTLALLLVLGVGYAHTRRRQRRFAHLPPRPFWGPEVQITTVLGVSATLMGVYLAHESDLLARRDTFRRLGTVHASLLQQAMFRIGDNYLEGVGRLFMSSNFVDQREFNEYVGFLLNRPYAQAWEWVPAVPATNRVTFEVAVRQWAVPDFAIWQHDDSGKRVPPGDREMLYPICYTEPLAGNVAALGFDLGSDPRTSLALVQAQRTRLITATDPISLVQRPGITNAIRVVRAVFAINDSAKLSGFAVVELRMDTLLFRALSRESTRNEATSDVALFQVGDDGVPAFLESGIPGRRPSEAGAPSLERIRGEFDSLIAPVFAFGKVYALAVRPGPDFARLHPLLNGRRAGATGIALTVLLTALVGMLSGRRTALERLVAERTAELHASESSYHGLFNSIRQAIYLLDVNGRFIDVNEGALAMYGYAREEFLGRTPEFLAAPGHYDGLAVMAAVRAAWQGTPQYFEFWGRRKNGEEFPKDVWLCRASYLGQTVVLAMATDISDRKRAEHERERLQSQLLQAQKMESIGRLAGGVAHDFNNMLQAILGNASLAIAEHPGPRMHEYLTEIRKSAERSADLTRQLLAFASRQTVSPRVLDLNDTISGMLKMLGRLIGEDIRLHWVPGTGVWSVKMDPSQLDQILANLAVNARDAIGGVGTVTIETSNQVISPESRYVTSAGAAPGAYAVLTVRDTGRGMDAQTLANIFEPFFTTKKAGMGIGLGLATVFGIAKQNHGFIDVTSSPGAGATFVIGIPRARGPAQPQVEQPPAAPPRGGTETLLIVEDEQTILRLSSECLRRLGYAVLMAESPHQALEVALRHQGPIHLLITDVVLPDMNGRELVEQLRAFVPGLKCLFMSGYTADIIADRGVLDGKLHFIQKPFAMDQLAIRVREILEAS